MSDDTTERLRQAILAVGGTERDMPQHMELLEHVLARILSLVCEYVAASTADHERRIAVLELDHMLDMGL